MPEKQEGLAEGASGPRPGGELGFPHPLGSGLGSVSSLTLGTRQGELGEGPACGSPLSCTLWPGLQTLWGLHEAQSSPSSVVQKWPWSQLHTAFSVLEHFRRVTRPMAGMQEKELRAASRTAMVVVSAPSLEETKLRAAQHLQA